jgi:predicted nucleotidyltransferase
MTDLYDQMMERFLSPLSSLTRGVVDALYFVRRDGAFVFTEGYLHPAGGLMGKVMLFPDRAGEVDIFGRRFRSSYKRMKDGKIELIPHDEQLQVQFEFTPSLSRGPRPVYEKYHVEFPRGDFIGVFEHRHSLSAARRTYASLDRAIESLSRAFDVPVSRLGCTGSTCYGKYEEPGDDIDLVFSGTLDENAATLRRIKELTRDPAKRVIEYGRLWPIRFYWDSIMICSFFNYGRDEDIPLKDCRMEVLEEKVRARGTVADDTHSIYMPSILTLSRLSVDGRKRADTDLIIYDGSLRGEYYRGDELEFEGSLVRVSTPRREYEAFLVTLRDQIALRPGK